MGKSYGSKFIYDYRIINLGTTLILSPDGAQATVHKNIDQAERLYGKAISREFTPPDADWDESSTRMGSGWFGG